MQRLALGISYNGSSWQGWQKQHHGYTLQDKLEIALNRFAGSGRRISTVCAGRTDARVHAAIQVVHFDTLTTRCLDSWVRGVNTFLPSSIAVHWAKFVPMSFHARFSARSRTYIYLLWARPERPALWPGSVGWCFQPLDIRAMQDSAVSLIGLHDFASFQSSQCQSKSSVRMLYDLEIIGHGPIIVFTLRANAFLHHMVRNILGALLLVGQHKRPTSWTEELLAARNRTLGAPTFAPNGLYLSAIEYPTNFALPELDKRVSLIQPFLLS